MRIVTQHYSTLLVMATGDRCDSRSCVALVLWLSADDEHSLCFSRRFAMSTKVDHAALTGLSFLRSTLLLHRLITLRLTIWVVLRVSAHQITHCLQLDHQVERRCHLPLTPRCEGVA